MPLPMKPRATEQWLDASLPARACCVCGGGGGERGEGREGLLPLEDAAGPLLWPRGLGAQDSPDRLVKDGFQASLGEG